MIRQRARFALAFPLRPLPAVLARLRTKIDDPIRRFDDFEIVLDHDDRVPGIDQALEKLQQNRNVIEMQSGCRFVENKKISARFDRLGGRRVVGAINGTRRRASLRFGQMPNEFKALRFSAG